MKQGLNLILIDGFVFQPVKIYIEDVCQKLRNNETGESAFTVERDILDYNIRIMKDIIGKLEVVENEPDNELIIEGCHVKFGPKIIILPSFAPTVTELREKLNHMKTGIKITNTSTLILKMILL